MAKPALKAALLSPQRPLGDHPLLVVGPSLGTSSILWNRAASLLGNDYDVVACDLNDAPAGVAVDQQKDSVRDLPSATGVIDLKTFLGALIKIGYDGLVRAEPFKAELRKLPREEAVQATAAAMKRAFSLVS